MKPAPFEYRAPRSVEETLELLAEYGDEAKVLAGGQSLAPMLNMRLAAPAVLVDINKVEELSYIREEGEDLVVGALARQRMVEKHVSSREGWPLLAEAMPFIGHVTNRNRGTVCGSIAHADPAAELPAVATALGATLRVVSPRGERTIGMDGLFVSYMMTNLEPDEVIAEVRFPKLAPRTGTAWKELARRHGDYAVAGVGASMTLDEAGRCERARIVCIGVSSVPLDVREAASILQGETPSEELFAASSGAVGEASEPVGDIHASAGYRRHVIEALSRQALQTAYSRAKEGERDGA